MRVGVIFVVNKAVSGRNCCLFFIISTKKSPAKDEKNRQGGEENGVIGLVGKRSADVMQQLFATNPPPLF